MEKAGFAANRAVALTDFDLGGRQDLEFNLAAMTPTAVGYQGFALLSQDRRDELSRRFHLRGVAAASRRTIHFGPVVENLLRLGDVGCLAFPGFQRWILQGAGVGEAHLPR